MNRTHTISSFLPRLAVGVSGALAFASLPALGQNRDPAATLLPARPAPAPLVVRGATPDSTLPSFTGDFVPSVPATGSKTSWAGAKIGVLKDSVFGKPGAPDPKAAASDSRLLAPPATNPLFGGSAQAPPQPQAPPPGTYASPPAYRWYGWGGTTPGANPHSPTGVYPQGSANWYAQSGATPGAFPITPGFQSAEALSMEAPAYAGKVASDPPFVVPIPTRMPGEPKPRFISGLPIPEPRIVARTPIGFAPPAMPEMPATPSVPSGAPVAIAGSSEGKTLPAEPAAPPAAELNWQSVGGRGYPAQNPIPAPPAPIAQPASSDPAWAPAPATPAIPTVSVIRGQSEGREPQSLEALIRSACIGRVAKADVRATDAGKLVVTFVAASENAARDAAALVAKLPELKPYDVTFEARIVPR